MSYLTEALKELNSKGEWSSKKVKKTNKKLNESANLNEAEKKYYDNWITKSLTRKKEDWTPEQRFDDDVKWLCDQAETRPEFQKMFWAADTLEDIKNLLNYIIKFNEVHRSYHGENFDGVEDGAVDKAAQELFYNKDSKFYKDEANRDAMAKDMLIEIFEKVNKDEMLSYLVNILGVDSKFDAAKKLSKDLHVTTIPDSIEEV